MAASKTLTPEQRIERARKAGNASLRDPNALIKRIANIAPDLTSEQIEQLRAIITRAEFSAKDDVK